MTESRNVLYARLHPTILTWVDDQATRFGISQAEFTTVVFKSLMLNYSDRELQKIILGIKPTLTPRDAIKEPKVRALKRNLKINLE